MGELRMTRARFALLNDVALGEVWQNSNGHSTATNDVGEDAPFRVVTNQIAQMEAVGWVRLHTHNTGAQQWLLTDAGHDAMDGGAR